MSLVSIVTASYNYQDYIIETIESVLNQTFQDWEMIIVDDGSTDNSVDVINKYCEKDKRIKLFCHENHQNKGLSQTIQLGISHANSDWIIFLESDDSITPDYIQKKMDVINKYPDIKFIFNDVRMFGDNQCIKNMDKYFRNLYSVLNKISFPTMLEKEFINMNLIPTFSCVMLKKEILDDVDFNSLDKRCLDLYIWAQLTVKYPFYYLNEKLTNWRMSKNSYIHNTHSELETKYFLKVIIPDIIEKNKNLSHRINFVYKALSYYFRQIRRKIIILHCRKGERKLILFGIKIFEEIKN